MNTAPPPLFNVQINTAVDDEEGPLSSVTSATLSDECKKAKRVRMTGSAAQSMRTARLHEKKKYNHAFNRATIVYAREKQKKGGLSARGVTELVKNEYNVDVCPRTVQVYGKKGNIGMSPQAELDVLSAWYQATKSKGAKKADKADQWKQILESGKRPPDYDRWTAEDEERIVGLAVQGNNIDISDTRYGREVALKKRE
jgi:hypothetical protein